MTMTVTVCILVQYRQGDGEMAAGEGGRGGVSEGFRGGDATARPLSEHFAS